MSKEVDRTITDSNYIASNTTMDVAFLILLFSWFFTVATTATPLVFSEPKSMVWNVSARFPSIKILECLS